MEKQMLTRHNKTTNKDQTWAQKMERSWKVLIIKDLVCEHVGMSYNTVYIYGSV